MSDEIQKEILSNLQTILSNIDTLDKKVDEQSQRIDIQFQRVHTAITLIGGDVDQLKHRVGRIEQYLELSDRSSSGH